MKKLSHNKLLQLVTAAMLIAAAFALYLIEIPFAIIPAFSYLKIDLGDVPALLAGIIFGPTTAFIVELIKNLLHLIVRGLGSQMGFGNLMNLIVGSAYIIPFSLIMKKYAKRHKKAAVIAVVAAVAAVIMVLTGLAGNYLIAPLFFKYFLNVELSKEALWSAVAAASALNAAKAVILSVLAFPMASFAAGRLKKSLGKSI